MAQGVRGDPPRELGQSHSRFEPLLDRCHRLAVELNKASGDQVTPIPPKNDDKLIAEYARRHAGQIVEPAHPADREVAAVGRRTEAGIVEGYLLGWFDLGVSRDRPLLAQSGQSQADGIRRLLL